ncbi:hypothetical protein RBH29_08540 [Herbivorax sp. ANBcel31]|uniref:LiaF transmembrane domain-containing protein n=1 Tax=Herbivorax sp. ANBcel31 TaxID=3069754 RepID=UPI0027B5FDBE|nr:hypothetical protein [Herbivorax sp. ANBcel31]MDQ2086475.1 hypothetical protein [Herbivorax sp. ANBcel31]
MKKNNPILGIALVLIGALLLAAYYFDTDIFSMSNLWPLIVLGLGITFEVSYFIKRKDPGILVPGGILTTLGLLFLFETFTNWEFSARTWPVYLLAVAIGLFQLYLFGGREKGLLIPVAILSAVAMTAYLDIGRIIPVALIAVGVYFIFSKNSEFD